MLTPRADGQATAAADQATRVEGKEVGAGGGASHGERVGPEAGMPYSFLHFARAGDVKVLLTLPILASCVKTRAVCRPCQPGSVSGGKGFTAEAWLLRLIYCADRHKEPDFVEDKHNCRHRARTKSPDNQENDSDSRQLQTIKKCTSQARLAENNAIS